MTYGRALSALGVTETEEDLYRFFLRSPRSRIEDAVIALNIDRDLIDAAYEMLQGHSLVRLAENGDIVASDPAVAVERLIDSRLQSLNLELRNVSGARAVIPSLLEDQQLGQANAGFSEIEQIEGLDEIRARLDDLAFFAHHEVLAFQPDGALSAGYVEAARPLDLRCLRRGVAMRTVILRDAVDDLLTEQYLRELMSLGAEIRTVDEPMERMIIYDRSIAVVPMDPESSARGALVIRQASLVANMVVMFERIWTGATVPDIGGDGPDGLEAVTVLERQVLTILAKSSKDEIAAREMGISVRTFRRHVADVMLRLGAANRFQAALLAKGRGWV